VSPAARLAVGQFCELFAAGREFGPRLTARTRSVARRKTGPTEETHAGSPRGKDRTNVTAVDAWLIKREAAAGMTCRSMGNVGPG